MRFASYCLAAVNAILSIHSVLGFHSVSPIVRNGPVIRSGRNAGLIIKDAVTIRSQGSGKFTNLLSKVDNKEEEVVAEKEPSAFDQVASKGLAGVLAIAAAEAIFWALGVPLASLWVKYTTGEWIDLMTTDGQLQAAGFSFGYGGFATLILQYRVTLFAIPLVPIMEKLVVTPGKKYFGEQFGQKKDAEK